MVARPRFIIYKFPHIFTIQGGCTFLINVSHLTFAYEGSYDNIFEDVSFRIDTNWRLGFIGRNGRGKTTFLKLLMGKYDYSGSISSHVDFIYFPFDIPDRSALTSDLIQQTISGRRSEQTEELIKSEPWKEHVEEYKEYTEEYAEEQDYEPWKIEKELSLLNVDLDVLNRPFSTLSNGEQTKVLLAALFLKDRAFLLIDEPTNHLDEPTRKEVGNYLKRKKSFILVSHDRALLDECVDHILSINKTSIDIQAGNFSAWELNKKRKDAYELAQNEKLQKEVDQMKIAAVRISHWSDLKEATKIGAGDKGYVGHKAAKLMKRSKLVERHRDIAIEQKEKLLKDLERTDDLSLHPLDFPAVSSDSSGSSDGSNSSRDGQNSLDLIRVDNLSLAYGDKCLCRNLSFTLHPGERIALQGKNGSGKTSILRQICCRAGALGMPGQSAPAQSEAAQSSAAQDTSVQPCRLLSGQILVADGLVISLLSQDTSFMQGNLEDFMRNKYKQERAQLGLATNYTNRNPLDLLADGLERRIRLLVQVLRQLDFSDSQMEKNLQDFSEGQKKKFLLAVSLSQRAHVYIWDEPLNFIDILSRVQIENLIRRAQPTMIFVEHDQTFTQSVATRIVDLSPVALPDTALSAASD